MICISGRGRRQPSPWEGGAAQFCSTARWAVSCAATGALAGADRPHVLYVVEGRHERHSREVRALRRSLPPKGRGVGHRSSLAHPLREEFCILPKIDNLWRKILIAVAHMRGQMPTKRGALPACEGAPQGRKGCHPESEHPLSLGSSPSRGRQGDSATPHSLVAPRGPRKKTTYFCGVV